MPTKLAVLLSEPSSTQLNPAEPSLTNRTQFRFGSIPENGLTFAKISTSSTKVKTTLIKVVWTCADPALTLQSP